MKYNLSLDYVAAAMAMFKDGKVNDAAEAFAKACKHSSAARAIEIVNASNEKAFKAEKATAAKAARVKFAAKATTTQTLAKRLLEIASEDAIDLDLAGEEMRVEVDNQETMPEVQEGAADEDEDDSDDDGDEDDKEEDAKVQQARFRKVLKNLSRG